MSYVRVIDYFYLILSELVVSYQCYQFVIDVIGCRSLLIQSQAMAHFVDDLINLWSTVSYF